MKNNSNRNNENEKNALLSLVKREGFNNIFNLISNSQFNRDNPVVIAYFDNSSSN